MNKLSKFSTIYFLTAACCIIIELIMGKQFDGTWPMLIVGSIYSAAYYVVEELKDESNN